MINSIKNNSIIKRLIAVLLALALAVEILPATAFANGDVNAGKTDFDCKVKEVALKDSHSEAVTETGDLYCWGWNYDGQVGNGNTEDQLTPVKILSNVESVSLGSSHSAAVTKEGNLYCWGDNDYGQVGNGNTEDQLTPVKILSNVESVSLGSYHSAAVTKEGDLYCWGENEYCQVGNGTAKDQLTPVKILSNVESVSLGSVYSAAVTKDGDLYCWGWNYHGQVEIRNKEDQLTPVKILSNVESVSLGIFHSAAVTKAGDLYCWGNNPFGEVGNGTTKDQLAPVKILSNVESVSLGSSHSAAVTKDGDLYCWGWNAYGQVGNGTTKHQFYPVKILSNVESVSLGSAYSAAVTKDGNLYCWGDNEDGQVGNGTTENQLTPVKIMGGSSSVTSKTDSSVLIYANKPLSSCKVGEVIDFRCVLRDSNNQPINWNNPSIMADNAEIASISGYYEDDTGAYFQVKGLSEGACTLTITDSATGVYGKAVLTFGTGITSTRSYRIDQVPNFTVDESTWIFGEAKTQTNFYNVGGLSVNQFVSTYNQDTQKYDISFNVYNSTYMNGAVDVYDATGKWIDSYELEKVSSASGIGEAFADGWELVSDLAFEKKGASYTLSSSAKETHIAFSIPKGGYFTISNNYYESPGVFLYNVLDYIALAFDSAFNLALNIASGEDMQIISFKKDVKNEIFKLDKFAIDELTDSMKGYAKESFKKGSEYKLGEITGVETCSFEELLDTVNIDLDDIAKAEFGIAESAFEQLTGPIGVALKALFSVNKFGDLFTQTIRITNSYNTPYIRIFATEEPYTSATVDGVTVNAEKDAVDEDAVLQVFKLLYEETIPNINNEEVPKGQYELYNIFFSKNGEETQLNGKATVMLPIPDSYKKDKCAILRQEEDGSWTQLDYKIQDNFLVFETTHFSLYALADTREATTSVEIAYDKLDLPVGSSMQIDFNVTPEEASKASLVWKSSNPMVAAVNDHGIVSAFSAGTATITATTADGNSTSCIINAIDTSTVFKLGDADGDGQITSEDALAILMHIASKNPKKYIEKNADCDGKPGVTTDDALAILMHVAGKKPLA